MEGNRSSIDFICRGHDNNKNASGVDSPLTNRETLHIPEDVKNHSRYQEWKSFHLGNRNVLKRIIHEIERGKRAGLKAISVKAIINAIRWDMTVETSGDGYKINDAYTGIYTHVIMCNFPEYKLLLTSRQFKPKSKKYKR